MHLLWLTGSALLGSGASSFVVRAPVRMRSELDLNVGRFSSYKGDSQQPILLPHDNVDRLSLASPVMNYQNVFFTVNISVGTPPQYFSPAIDTSMSVMFIPSANCPPDDLYPGGVPKHVYNSSLSSTYKFHGANESFDWAGLRYSGYLSDDTVRAGGVEVLDFRFQEYTSASMFEIGAYPDGYDGVIGLAPPWHPTGRETIPNLLSSILSQGVLESAMFSLKLPRNVKEEGELLLGGANPNLFDTEPIWIPLEQNVPHQNYPFQNAWTLPVQSITFDTVLPLHAICNTISWKTSSSACFAHIDSSLPYILLPHDIYSNISATLGAQPGFAWFEMVDCSLRAEMPALTFSLDGNDFSISAFEYTLEVEIPHEGVICLLSIMNAADFLRTRDSPGIVLGSPFLRGFYSQFDMHGRRIGFSHLK